MAKMNNVENLMWKDRIITTANFELDTAMKRKDL